MFSLGVSIIFSSLAVTAIYLSYKSHKYHYSLLTEMANINEPLVHIHSEEKGESKLSRFYTSKKHGQLLLVSMLLITGGGLFTGIFILFFYEKQSTRLLIEVTFLIATYIILIYQSEILRTTEFIESLTPIDNKYLRETRNAKAHWFEAVLSVRKKQFLVIAVFLVIFGISLVILDIYLIQFIIELVISYLTFAEDIIISTVTGRDFWSGLLRTVLFIAAIIVLILVFIVEALYIYIGLCMRLIRIEEPDPEIVYYSTDDLDCP